MLKQFREFILRDQTTHPCPQCLKRDPARGLALCVLHGRGHARVM
ncbi:MAG: hypothetical protein QOI73_1504 [Solirubrobacteraceae bacterium]|nr:hypothetical protein [Solirubrobacteraceae bacterium]